MPLLSTTLPWSALNWGTPFRLLFALPREDSIALLRRCTLSGYLRLQSATHLADMLSTTGELAFFPRVRLQMRSDVVKETRALPSFTTAHHHQKGPVSATGFWTPAGGLEACKRFPYILFVSKIETHCRADACSVPQEENRSARFAKAATSSYLVDVSPMTTKFCALCRFGRQTWNWEGTCAYGLFATL